MVVTSPVRAGNCPACSVPLTCVVRLTFAVEHTIAVVPLAVQKSPLVRPLKVGVGVAQVLLPARNVVGLAVPVADRLLVPMLVRVLLAPEIVLLVSVCAVAIRPTVSVAPGNVYVYEDTGNASVGAPAPVVVNDAPSVMVLPVLATPVPPY